MTKEEYFRTPWESKLNTRVVYQNGLEFYFSSKPVLNYYRGSWDHKKNLGETYESKDIAEWWHESLQTKEQYLQLQKTIN